MNVENIVNEISKIKDKLLSDKKLLFKILLVIVIIILALFIRATNKNKEEVIIDSNSTQSEQATSYQNIYADISGEVQKPGIYKVEEDTRLYQLIDKAGGLTNNADIDAINQAEIISDGQKIIIPTKQNSESEANTAFVDDTSGTSVKTSALININNATLEQLKELPGVGDSIASRIIEYRKEKRFSKKEDLMNVKGIGEKTYSKMESMIIA